MTIYYDEYNRRLEEATSSAEDSSGKMRQVVNGDDSTEVIVEGGTAPSILKFMKDQDTVISDKVQTRTDILFANAESDINQAVADAEQSATDAQDAADSIGRYQGLWPDTGGSALKGDTYQTQVGGTPTGQYFTVLQNTTTDPVGDDVNWREVVSTESLSQYTDIVYRALGGNSAVDNMVLGAPISANDGDIVGTGYGRWEINNEKGIDLDSGLKAFPLKSEVYPEDFGAIGDGIADDTQKLQETLYLFGDGNPTSGVEIKVHDLIVNLTNKYRITAPIHQPSGVQVVGNAKLISNPLRGLDLALTNSCVVIVDFQVDTLRSAWLISGYARNGLYGLSDTDLIDPYIHLVGDLEYNSGNVTRSYKNRLVDVQFYTDKYVASPVSACACPDVELRIASYGFLGGGYIGISWTYNAELYGLTYHYGGFFYSPNGGSIDGYLAKLSTGSPPPLDVSSAPAGWQTDVATSYGTAERYWTTGLYGAFSNAVTTNSMVTEGYQRSRLYWNCEGWTENSPYIEAIENVAFHNVNSSVIVNAPQMYATPYVVSSGGGSESAMLVINGYRAGDAEIALNVQSSGPKTHITMGSQSLVLDGDKFSTSVSFQFLKQETLTIYVDPTSGDDSKLGFTMGNAVKSVGSAIQRLNRYGDGVIIVKDGEVSQIGKSSVAAERNITIKPESSTATLNFNTSGTSTRQIEQSQNTHFGIQDMSVTVSNAGSTGDSRGAFRPKGDCSINMDNCVTSISSGGSLIVSRSYQSSIVTFTQNGGSIVTDILASNDYSSLGSVKLIRSKSNITETGAQAVQDNFTEL